MGSRVVPMQATPFGHEFGHEFGRLLIFYLENQDVDFHIGSPLGTN